MLSDLLSSQRGPLDALAAAWLEAGATTVTLWQDGALLAHWPADRSATPLTWLRRFERRAVRSWANCG